MLDPAVGIEDQTNTAPLLFAMADYAATFRVESGPAIAASRQCLIEALGRGLEALRDPECAALIGPVVPGAVMPGGARVPGTSLELEPAQAAFCIGLMLGRPAGRDPWPTAGGARAADALGPVLAATDYRARKAVMEGKPPPRVRDLLAASLKALEIQGALAALDGNHDAPGASPLRQAHVAAAALAAAQLGGTREQVVRAISLACVDGHGFAHEDVRPAMGSCDWVWADAMSRAVRHACQATGPGRPGRFCAADLELVRLAGARLGAGRSLPREPFGTVLIERIIARRGPRDEAHLTARFRAAVDRAFPSRQAERVKALFAAPERLDELPVNELIAALVTNGAR